MEPLLTETERRALIRAALEARRAAYAPYSHFLVGAALLCDSGRIYAGCNVENASYGATICAERNAALQAVTAGERHFAAIAVVGWPEGGDGGERAWSYPCGICRQFLYEFALPGMEVCTARSEEDYQTLTLEALLPKAFGPAALD